MKQQDRILDRIMAETACGKYIAKGVLGFLLSTGDIYYDDEVENDYVTQPWVNLAEVAADVAAEEGV